MAAYLAFLFPLFTAPYVVQQRRKLHRLPTLRDETHRMSLSARQLAVENSQLEALQIKLKSQASRLAHAEEQLRQIAEAQGATDLEKLVTEHGRLSCEIRTLQESAIMGEIAKAFMCSDISRDFKVDESEMEILFTRLNAISGIPKFDETELRLSLRSSQSKSIGALVGMTKALLQQDRLQIEGNVGNKSSVMV